MKTNKLRMLVASLGIASVSAVALSGVALAEFDPTEIDSTKDVTLSVHKLEGGATGDKADGKEITHSRAGVAGVKFQLYHITSMSIAKGDDWNTFATMKVDLNGKITDENGNEVAKSSVSTPVVTDASGDAIWELDSSAQGFYMVKEIESPDNVVSTTAPFLVALPLPHKASGDWLYTVHSYPKTAVTNITIAVDDSPGWMGLGGTLEWTVVVDVPKYVEELGSFTVNDVANEALELTGTPVAEAQRTGGAPVSVDVTGAQSQDAKRTFTFNTGTETNPVKRGDKVTLKYKTKVVGLGDHDGEIQNRATVNVYGKSYQSTPATSQWGEARLKAHTGEGNDQKLLSGVSFQIYASDDMVPASPKGTPISVDGETTFTTGGSGEEIFALVKGLNIGVSEANNNSRDYFVQQTAVPAGYVVNPTPVKLSLEPGEDNEISIPTVLKHPSGHLPTTGAAGTYLIYAAAGLLVLGGSAALIGHRRKVAQK